MPSPPWRDRKRERRRAAPARRPLDYDQIVDAALAVLDAEGVDAMSMRRVAQQLGTGAASLYAHVQNKEELVDAVIERILSDVEIPAPTGDWREDFVRIAYVTRDALGAHRDAAKALWGRVPTGPNAIRLADHVYGMLRRLGLPDQLVAWAGPLLFDYITTDAYEGSLYSATFGDENGTIKYFESLSQYFASLPHERFPNVVELAGTLTTGGGEERFAFGLDVLLTGLKAKASEALGDGSGDS
ncbi:TetR/AcrR family transcriptional regulator C-terminal domain-containing protein [Cryptosporangium sp. NPDC051539]|uniref:TetR/AcrR family transcriptional regulator C-terminal domain-containing protein n=1 Tax=Cryptosporangium sp. NPDC051539 TaxID=3363962 RepID=UPI0037902DAF